MSDGIDYAGLDSLLAGLMSFTQARKDGTSATCNPTLSDSSNNNSPQKSPPPRAPDERKQELNWDRLFTHGALGAAAEGAVEDADAKGRATEVRN